MSMGVKGRGGSLADINVTPLVDVLLVLLIIFMVTVPQIHHGAKIATPDVSEGTPGTPDPDEEKATLSMELNGALKLRGQVVDKEKLLDLLRVVGQLQKNKELYLNANPELNYVQVMEIIGIMRRAGIVKMGVVVQPDDLK